MSRSLFPRLLLIVALLFAQMGGIAHAISHTLENRAPEHAISHDKHCDLCEVYAQIGSAVGSSAPTLATGDNVETPHSFAAIASSGGTRIAHPARAPPCLA